ncbi:hypothetical protein EDM68_02040 [Candidatus Uhrbacteria bacterium]|nr:MAG: hypothetical protein EDM68_02040 [Candidatus Uhrbacteria bacterium]
MKKQTVFWAGLTVIVLFAAGWFVFRGAPSAEPSAPAMSTDEAAVREVVTEFGDALQKVSLNESREASIEAIRREYASYLSPELLEEWASQPHLAIGRYASSPWPGRIEITRVIIGTPTRYAVFGEIIQMTGVEETQGGEAGRSRVEFTVDKIGDRWLIIGAAESRNW